MTINEPSGAGAIRGYSFLRVFANDKTIDAQEFAFLERLAMRDGAIDSDEQAVLSRIFGRIHLDSVPTELRQQIESFKKKHDIL